MSPLEHSSDAMLPLLLFAGILLLGTVMAKLSGRFGIPSLVFYLGVGFLLGSDVSGLIPFDDAGIAQGIGITALAIILFEGGLQTPPERIRPVIGGVISLATGGVVITAALMGLLAHVVAGLSWEQSLLLGAIVGSTDAAAVFASLRNRPLAPRVARLLEGESGVNDPMAVFLMLVLLQWISTDQPPTAASALLLFTAQMGIGAVTGLLGAHVAMRLVRFANFESSGLYPLALLSAALTVFAGTSLIGGSGFLAVYLMGVMLAGHKLPFHATMLRFHEGLAWMMQITMFVLLGLLAFPAQVAAEAGPGILLTLALMFVARPIAVFLVTPWRYSYAERLFISWAGLRGAVPIILATYPLIAGIEAADTIFNLVVFVVVGSALVQGTTLSWLANKLGLLHASVPRASIALELEGADHLDAHLVTVPVTEASAAAGKTLRELDLPPQISISAVVRSDDVIAPYGGLRLRTGDTLYVLITDEDVQAATSLLTRPV